MGVFMNKLGSILFLFSMINVIAYFTFFLRVTGALNVRVLRLIWGEWDVNIHLKGVVVFGVRWKNHQTDNGPPNRPDAPNQI